MLIHDTTPPTATPVYGPVVERTRRVAASGLVAVGLLAMVLLGPGPGAPQLAVFAALTAAIVAWQLQLAQRTRRHADAVGEPWPDDWAAARRHPVLVLAGPVLAVVVVAVAVAVTDVPAGVALGSGIIAAGGAVHGSQAHLRRTGRTPRRQRTPAPLGPPTPR